MNFGKTVLAALFILSVSPASMAADPQPKPEAPPDPASQAKKFASDNDSLDGDHLKLKVNIDGFEQIGGGQKKFCAPIGSKLSVTRPTETHLYVRFKQVPRLDNAPDKNGKLSTGEAATKAAIEACQKLNELVNEYMQYKIERKILDDYSYRRTGVMFGALVVPFKFYLGSDSKLSASSTVAPYIGFRGPAPFKLTFTPVLSAGLGLVPVTDATSGETNTRSALSVAVGVLLTHTKNEKFNAGIIFGKDFLSKSDRGNDKAVDDLWFSLYAGYAL